MKEGPVILTVPNGSRQQATCIKLWARGDEQIVMSASSGPKDYMKNVALSLFETTNATRVAFLNMPGKAAGPNRLAIGPILFLLEIDGVWQDVKGFRPKIEPQG